MTTTENGRPAVLMVSKKSILLVEDDLILARELEPIFREVNIQIEHVADGSYGLERGLSGDHLMVILDVILPGINGFDICRALRIAKPVLPVMLLTTRGHEVDKVLGLELGADDYMVKPFSAMELVARVRSKLRQVEAYRQTPGDAPDDAVHSDLISLHGFVLDPERRTLTKNGRPLEMTRKEFDLLHVFMRSPGKVFSKRELLRAVWQVDFWGYEDSVVSMVRRVRCKIGDGKEESRYIRTVHGLGYAFADGQTGVG